MCYNFATFVLYLDVITLIYRENRLTSSETSLSAINAENQQIAKQTPNFTPKNVKLGVFVLFKISYLREWAISKSANSSSCLTSIKSYLQSHT